jgi:hypothetical protein
MDGEYSLDYFLDMSKQDKEGFWEMMYIKVREAVLNSADKAVIFEIEDKVEDKEDTYEVTSVVLDSNQFSTFLNNYLVFCEETENYERCIEIKALIDPYNSKGNL